MGAYCGLNERQIAATLDLDVRQVRYALENEHSTPRKPTGRPPILDAGQVQMLVDFVTGSKRARRMSYKELAQEFFYWGAGEEAIKNALTCEGFNMRTAMCKPPIS